MLLVLIRVIYAFICAGAIAAAVQPEEGLPQLISDHKFAAFLVMFALTQVLTLGDVLFRHKRLEIISAVYFGLLIGSLLAYLLLLGLGPVIQASFRPIVALLLAVMLPYICISFLLQ